MAKMAKTIDEENRQWVFDQLKKKNVIIKAQSVIIKTLIGRINVASTPEEFAKELELEKININL